MHPAHPAPTDAERRITPEANETTLPWLTFERWQTHLVNMIETNRQDWPRTNTSRFSEMDWYTVLTETITPLHNFHPMYYQDHHLRPAGDPLTVNQTYAMLAACAATATRWLQEDLGPRLHAVDLEIPPEMQLQPDEDIRIWARYRNQPMPPEPEDFREFLHWAAVKMARALPVPDAAEGERATCSSPANPRRAGATSP